MAAEKFRIGILALSSLFLLTFYFIGTQVADNLKNGRYVALSTVNQADNSMLVFDTQMAATRRGMTEEFVSRMVKQYKANPKFFSNKDAESLKQLAEYYGIRVE